MVTTIFGWLLYLIVAYFSYLFVFDRRIFNHPRYLKNQMWLEIERAMTAIPIMVALTNPFFLFRIKKGFHVFILKLMNVLVAGNFCCYKSPCLFCLLIV